MIQINELELAPRELSIDELRKVTGGDSASDNLALLQQSTAQTLAIQNALLAHNLTIGPIMAAKSASEDAKKI
jgi:DNA-binding PucR family transcriptional regulator